MMWAVEIAADVAPNIPEDLPHLRLLAGQDSRLFLFIIFLLIICNVSYGKTKVSL